MLKQMQTQRRADSRPPLPHQDEFPAEYSLARLLSSRAGLRFLCYPHPQLEINRWLLFFGQRQLSPNSTVSSHDAGHHSALRNALLPGGFQHHVQQAHHIVVSYPSPHFA
jgi:hypothetical protein